jgi:hypothetical protein
MNSKKIFFVMCAVFLLLVGLAIAILAYGDIQVGKQAKKLLDLRLESRLLDEQQTALIQAQKDIDQYQDLEKTAKAVVPQDKDQARAVREIIRIAGESDITIGSISFPTSSLGSRPTSTAPTSSGANTGESAPAAATAPVPISQAIPVEGIPGVYALEMNIVPDGNHPVSYYSFLNFLKRLENNRRTAQVTSVKITPLDEDQTSSYITFTLTIDIFVKP